MVKNCLICRRIEDIKSGQNPYFVQEMQTGYVVLGDFQMYQGYTLFLSKIHVSELHELKENRNLFLQEMGQVSEAVFKAFKPRKLNYELLGNSDPHLHWHIIPRYADDPLPQSPIWAIDRKIRNAGQHKPSPDELTRSIEMIKKFL
jgi:diadenosine tetraphosphate (Ap4A) HIT family hydrolase